MPENAAPCAMEARHKQIEERAYVLWEGEGRPDGRDRVHWCQAESEVMAAGVAGSGAKSATSTASSPSPTKAAGSKA